MSNLKVWSNDTDTVIATDIDDVRRIVKSTCGYSIDEEGGGVDEWYSLPDSKVIKIDDSEGELRKRGFKTETNPISGHEVVARTCAEWIASEGRGFLCSTEY